MKKEFHIYWIPSKISEDSMAVATAIEKKLNEGAIIERIDSTSDALYYLLSIEK